MSVTVYEQPLSGNFTVDQSSASISRVFWATGSINQAEVKTAVALTAGVFYFGLVRSRINADHQGGVHWIVTVEYSNIDPQQAADLQPSEAPGSDPNAVTTPGPTQDMGPSFNFDFSGQPVKIYQARETMNVVDAGPGGGTAGARDNQLAIGATDKGVEGTEIYGPSGAFGRTVDRTAVTPQYLKLIFQLTGTVNFAHKFFAFDEGEVLYLGASGNQVQFNKWSVSHKFAYSPNETDLVVAADEAGAPLIKFGQKRGWDYLDVKYEHRQIGNVVREVPVRAFIHRVYRTGDLKLLGAGG